MAADQSNSLLLDEARARILHTRLNFVRVCDPPAACMACIDYASD
jgi:hypothetical protein